MLACIGRGYHEAGASRGRASYTVFQHPIFLNKHTRGYGNRIKTPQEEGRTWAVLTLTSAICVKADANKMSPHQHRRVNVLRSPEPMSIEKSGDRESIVQLVVGRVEKIGC